jgi:hypothetical protein
MWKLFALPSELLEGVFGVFANLQNLFSDFTISASADRAIYRLFFSAFFIMKKPVHKGFKRMSAFGAQSFYFILFLVFHLISFETEVYNSV